MALERGGKWHVACGMWRVTKDNGQMQVSSKVTAAYKQTAVLDYLAGRFTYRSRAEWLDLVAHGRVTRNGQPCTVDTIVTQGDVVGCDLPDMPLPEKFDFNYQIVYEDDWLLGINKPGHLLVHDKRQFAQANLIYHLRVLHQPPHPEAKLANRLDKDTSGVVLAARDSQTLQMMQQLFAGQQVQKEYLALVRGVPTPAAGVIDLPVDRLHSLPGVYRFGVVEGGKTAVTHYETVQTFGEQFALLRLFPKTGRTHQLRVHLQAIGHTIVGDVLYSLPMRSTWPGLKHANRCRMNRLPGRRCIAVWCNLSIPIQHGRVPLKLCCRRI
ncbi:MAG: RluA family pseudouridine synthase [Anaerolineae bacterium]|nr:RluA family pseudouridine synthase [Anaerolineae bacterium]